MKTYEKQNSLESAELRDSDLRKVAGGTEEAFDKAQTEILALISEATASHWTRAHFQEEAENVLRNTPCLDSMELMRLNQLIIILLSQLPV